MSKDNLSCRTCVPPKRYPGCHGKCPEYIDWKTQREEELKEVRKTKELESKLNDTEVQRSRKLNKLKKNKRRFGK